MTAAVAVFPAPCRAASFFDERPCSHPGMVHVQDVSLRTRGARFSPSEGLSVGSHALITEDLAQLAAPGDVLQVFGNGRFSQIGAAGGLMGHVLLVLAKPRRVEHGSPEAKGLKALWPASNPRHVWKVSTLESTRSRTGLHRANMIVHVDSTSGCFVLCGEVSMDGAEVVVNPEAEKIVVWQSPGELRSSLRFDLMSQVLSEMLANTESWSMTTAVRALFLSAGVIKNVKPKKALRNIQSSWKSAPICTSIAVVFWQKYLCKLANTFTADSETALTFILRWMPLKGDRTLPGQLSDAMQKCGWRCVGQCQEVSGGFGNSDRALRNRDGSLEGAGGARQGPRGSGATASH